MERHPDYPDSPMDPMDADDLDPTPCKGCGLILEEGKAFELSGLRWHINCFRCSTCDTLLDSDANLLLLGDGSLICNNCTYSCSACGNKIEDLAILTGDHAYCAPCFKCMKCKKKIENLRYARTSQGMFCMDCHDALMARRRKKSVKSVSRKHHLDKSLPSLPTSTFAPQDMSSDAPLELPGSLPPPRIDSAASNHRDKSPAALEREYSELADTAPEIKTPIMQSDSNQRQEAGSRNTARFEMAADEFIPMVLDTAGAGDDAATIEAPERDAKTSELPHREEQILGSDVFNIREKSSKRKGMKDSRLGELAKESDSQLNSPVTPNRQDDLLEKRKAAAAAAAAVLENRGAPSRTQSDQDKFKEQDKFKLQDAPKRRKSNGQQNGGTPAGEGFPVLSLESSPIDLSLSNQFASPGPLREQHINIGQSDSARNSQLTTPTQKSAHILSDSKQNENSLDLPTIPKRGDSLQKPQQLVPRKEVPGPRSASHESSFDGVSPSAARSYENSSNVNGGLVISRPIESPVAKSVNTTTIESGDDSTNGDSFISPRAPPPRPSSIVKHRQKGSVGAIRSESRNDEPGSPGLNRFHQHSETDEGRTTTEDGGPGFFQRTFSKSVRHARSHSDRGSRGSRDNKWPKPSVNGGAPDRDLASPTMSSPDPKLGDPSSTQQELARLRHESMLERQRVLELEAKVAELEGTLDGKASINKVNSELREKRSTIVVLDTQKEIFIRELEVISEHLQAAKIGDTKMDLGSLQQRMLTDFVAQLNKLKDSYTPQIEELLQRKSDVQDDLDDLVQKRERAFREFEQLSAKNAQLAELNNELQSKIHLQDQKGSNMPGLGIYTHHYPKDKNHLSFDSRDLRDSITDMQYSTSTLADPGAETAQILHAPQVVNIQKAQASKKSYWKKGGGTVAKGMKGLKGAFTSTDNKTGRDGQPMGLTEGIPYGQMVSGGDPMPVTILPGGKPADGGQNFAFFNQQKGRAGPKSSMRDGFGSVPAADPSVIFGSELEMRAAYEHVSIPYVVTRCIQEVEQRGMYSEGIYRKSGSKTQTDGIKEMFQRGDESEISDPDFDINAVASALKQYFRNLPTPLLTFAIYDRLLEATKLPHQECVVAVRNCIIDLPPRHRDTLEYLIFHLARVVKLQEENLMTSVNCGVVFAPTIMVGEDAQQDLQNTQQKNWLITFLIDHCTEIFLHSGEGLDGLG